MEIEYAIKKLREIDNGKFNNLLKTIELKKECLSCRIFYRKFVNEYQCKNVPHCIGKTLNKELCSFFVWKMELQNEHQHRKFLMSIGEIPNDSPRQSGYLLPIGVENNH